MTKSLLISCFVGDMEGVEDILNENGEVDINNGDDEDLNSTPLVCAIFGNHLDIVKRLLEHPGLQLDKIVGEGGETALHLACYYNRVSIVILLCKDSRCSPGVVNMKDRYGNTALMRAVVMGHIDIVRELDKEGTDFFTEDGSGRTLTARARMVCEVEVEEEDGRDNEAVLKYLLERTKVDSLQVIAAHNDARYVRSKDEVDTLEIPVTLRGFLSRFVKPINF